MPIPAPIVIAVLRARFTAIAGPTVVESGTTTVLLLPGDRAPMSGHGVLDIAMAGDEFSLEGRTSHWLNLVPR